MVAEILGTCGLVKPALRPPLLCCWERLELPRELCPKVAEAEGFWPTGACRGRWVCPLVACGGGWATIWGMPAAMPYRLLWEAVN